MPSRERVAALISMVEQGKYVEAIQEFYAEDATICSRCRWTARKARQWPACAAAGCNRMRTRPSRCGIRTEPAAMRRSMELMATEVMPRVNRALGETG